MAAEANNRKANSDDTAALNYVNQVRARASLAPLNVSGANLTNAIYQERR